MDTLPLSHEEQSHLDRVRTLSSFDRLTYWIRQREHIRLYREAQSPAPWTPDPILQRYRFCNVRRMDDRTSRWLLNHWYTPHHGHPNMVLACVLARQLNLPAALETIGFPTTWEPELVLEILEQRTAQGFSNYSGAYVITSNFGKQGRARQTKAYQTVHIVCAAVEEAVRLGGLIITGDYMQEAWQSLLDRRLPGLKSFMAGQVVADLRWGIPGRWRDRGTWAPLGPGSSRGLNRLLGQPIDTRVDSNTFVRELRALMARCRRALPGALVDRLEAMDYQNALCEWDKYEKALQGEGTPKRRYYGGTSPGGGSSSNTVGA